MATSPLVGAPYIEVGQQKKEVAHSEGINRLEIAVAGLVLDRNVTDPSTLTPANGDCYIVPSGAVGDWSGQTNKIAGYYSGWVFLDPFDGLQVWLKDESTYARYDAATSSWLIQTLTLATINGIGDVDITTTTPTAGDHLKWDGVNWVPGTPPNTVTAFLGLSDTPSAFTAGQLLRVNSGGTALELIEDPFSISTYKAGTLTAGETILLYVADRPFTLKASLTGSQGKAKIAPDTDAVQFEVRKNGASVGTIDWAVGATTPTFTMASATSFIAGDELEIVETSATTDTTAAGFAVTLQGIKN